MGRVSCVMFRHLGLFRVVLRCGLGPLSASMPWLTSRDTAATEAAAEAAAIALTDRCTLSAWAMALLNWVCKSKFATEYRTSGGSRSRHCLATMAEQQQSLKWGVFRQISSLISFPASDGVPFGVSLRVILCALATFSSGFGP